LTSFQYESKVRMTEKPLTSFTPLKLVEPNSNLGNEALFASLFTKAGKLRKRRPSGKQLKVEQVNLTPHEVLKSPPKRAAMKRKSPNSAPKRQYNRKIKKEESNFTKIENIPIAQVNERIEFLTDIPVSYEMTIGSTDLENQSLICEKSKTKESEGAAKTETSSLENVVLFDTNDIVLDPELLSMVDSLENYCSNPAPQNEFIQSKERDMPIIDF